MSVLEHPQQVHVTRRANTMVTACPDVEDWTSAHEAYFADGVRRLVESMPRHPHVPPPPWVTFGPDEEGNYDGPSGHAGPLSVSSSWSPSEGAVMWVDGIGMPDVGDLTPKAARQFSVLLPWISDTPETRALSAHLARVASTLDPHNHLTSGAVAAVSEVGANVPTLVRTGNEAARASVGGPK
jgi:hypothetical protein